MVSDPVRIAIAALGLAAGSAGVVATLDSPRLLVACALAGLAAAAWGGAALRRLSRQPTPAPVDPLPPPRPDLDAALEHAPLALWRLTAGAPPLALNAAARRLLAPGRVVEPAALLALLDAESGRRVVTLPTEHGQERAVLAVSRLTVQGEAWRLAALAPIESELETETLVAWRQLVQVLTHEIMNSLTPIASLAASAPALLEAGEREELQAALDTLARRAAHLQGFVERYRSVSQPPAPTLADVQLGTLLQAVQRLVEPAWTAAGGAVTVRVEPANLALRTDAAQLEQVLINLAQNALQACAGRGGGEAPQLQIEALLSRGARLRLTVADNGPGVAPGLEGQIFTPFFTTREGGSGIGLAVVRQLVHGLGGTVRHAKRPGGGACFVLTF
ncbi:ATP-binding protein [Roseateles asaccharophilus]|uniref:histidine kinase n=1 Tax=Roseateles asaccharophilus TaxID=582607 RepID=A0ABU2AEZ9_9BURK|nr:ATP-binding protein [Roseateles asaccharophilus]MDR7335781.1 C4-dicarboxylate-specific signal transduction histidine kinase [Roseateles asaccharophilus]